MLSKPFFGYARPKFTYELLTAALPKPVPIARPSTATLLLPRPLGPRPSILLEAGKRVRTGQRLAWDELPGPCTVSSVTGSITSIEARLGNYGRSYTAITVAVDPADEWDESFGQVCSQLTPQLLSDYLCDAPGAPPLEKLAAPKAPLHTIVVYGGDTDLLVDTNLYVLKSQTELVARGIQVLKQVSGIDHVILAVPGESFQNYDGHFGAEVRAVSNRYPCGQPLMLYHRLFGRILDQGQSFESQGVLFLRAEAAASLGRAVSERRVPFTKLVTVLDQQGRKRLVEARLGTPVGDLLKAVGISVGDGDRLIFGGPMTGTAIYSTEQPVQSDTDAVMVQKCSEIILSSDYACINCGECIRICPARVPVNMLVRYLENGRYQEGADLYDLYSCVECGLCGLVCASRTPILQYIKLAKYELARTTPAEAAPPAKPAEEVPAVAAAALHPAVEELGAAAEKKPVLEEER